MSRINVAFVGQCHTVGYAGVPPDAAFPEVCRRVLQASRPDHRVELTVEPYYHPAELRDAVAKVLRGKPRVVVIEVVGWLAIAGSNAVDLSKLPRGIRSTFERTRYFRRTRQHIAQQTRGDGLIVNIQTNALALAGSVLRPLLPRMPRPSVVDYEACVVDALSLIAAAEGTTAVIQGPGGNLAVTSKPLPPDATQRYRAVHEMARRVAEANGALYVDRWDTVTGGFFLPGTTRPTAEGHSVWGHLLADELLRAGVV